MDFSLSAEQRELKAAAIDFARRELDRDVAKRDEAGEFAADAWRACAKFGIQGLPVPEELGGGGVDLLTTVLVMEALGTAVTTTGSSSRLTRRCGALSCRLSGSARPSSSKPTCPDYCLGRRDGMVKT